MVALTNDERDRLATICASLPPADAALLARAVPALRPSQREVRDAALRSLATRFYRDLPSVHARARAIETDLGRAVAIRGVTESADEKRTAIAAVLHANAGQSLRWRTIFDVIT